MSSRKGQYIPSLDGLRAISVAFVFFAHAGVSHMIPGGFGVTVFFFLSGYLITTLLVQEYDTHQSIAIKAFYLRRLIRLAPPLLITLLFAVILAQFDIAEGDLSPGGLATLASQLFFFYNYFSIYAVQFPDSIAGLGVLWSLAVEEHFYLVYPLVFAFLARGQFGLQIIIALLVTILLWRMVRFYGFGDIEWQIFIRTDTRIDSILYGCLLALMAGKGADLRWFPDRFMYPLLTVAILALIVTFLVRDPAFRSTVRYSIQGLALLPIFHYAVTRHETWLFRPLNWKPVRRIGQYSYTLYLVHYVILKAMVFQGIATGTPLLFTVIAGGLSIAYAALVYEIAEKPLKPLRQKLTGH